MKHSFKKLIGTAILASSALSMSALATNGNQPVANGQSARGVAGAGIAYPQDTIAVLINPAAGVHIGNRVDAGLELFSPDRDMTLGGQTFDGNDTDVFPVPELGYNRLLGGGDKSFSLVLSAAGGQNTDYAFHPLLGGPSLIDLAQVFIMPTYSMKVDKNSFGVGLNIVYQQFEAEGIGALSAASANPSKFSDNGSSDSIGAGLSLGWIGEITDAVSIGAMYQSEIGMSDFDEYVGIFPDGSIDIPEKYGVGLAVAASPKVDVLFDVTQVNYSKTGIGNSTHGDGRSPLGTPNGPGFGWDDITVYRLGVVYKHSADLTLRAGWNHGDNPVPNETFNDGFFNSLVPAVTQDHLALGFTRQINPGLSVTGSYVRTFDETLEGNGVKLTQPGAGTPAPSIRMDQNAVGLTFSWLL